MFDQMVILLIKCNFELIISIRWTLSLNYEVVYNPYLYACTDL